MVGRGERPRGGTEPQPLGIEPDLEATALWDEFVGDKRRPSEVYAVWQDTEVTNPTIRQRLASSLTVPRDYPLPYNAAGLSIDYLVGLTEEVDGRNTWSLRQRLANKPKLQAEVVAGIQFWLGLVDQGKLHINGEAETSYNKAIYQLLPLVDQKTGDSLFEHFDINDPVTFADQDEASGYNPLKNLLMDTEVPDRYKHAGLMMWFEIADMEIEGRAVPRVEHERATSNMVYHLMSTSFYPDVDKTTNTAIVQFLNDRMDGPFVAGSVVCRIANTVEDPDIKFRFAYRHIMTEAEDGEDYVELLKDQDLELLEWMMEEAKARELPEFGPKAKAMAKTYKNNRRQRDAAATAHHAAEDGLRARLRNI